MTPRTERERWSAFAVCLMAASLAILDISKVNVAIPTIEAGIGASPAVVQFIVSGYVLAFGLVLVPAGRAGDLRGRRRLFIIGIGLFGAASLACGFAPSVEYLVAGRLLEGAAAGILMPQSLGLIQQLFSGAERGRAFGYYGAMMGLTLATAPALGGVLVALGGPEWGWRLVFLVNVPIVAVIVPLAARLLPEDARQRGRRGDSDPVGILLLGTTTLTLMAPFALTTGTAGDNPARWLLLIVAAATGALFVVWERRYAASGRAPVVDVAMFRRPSYRNGVILALAYYAGAPAALLVVTLYLQQGLGLSPLQAGLAFVPYAIAFIISSWLCGRAAHRLGRNLVIGGLCAAMLGWGLSATLAMFAEPHVAAVIIPIGLTISGAGSGAVVAPNQLLTLQDVPPAHGGLAGSMAQVAQRLAAAIGVAVLVSIFYGTLSRELGTRGDAIAYHDAFRNAMLAVVAFFIVALVVAVCDEWWRRRETMRLTGE